MFSMFLKKLQMIAEYLTNQLRRPHQSSYALVSRRVDLEIGRLNILSGWSIYSVSLFCCPIRRQYELSKMFLSDPEMQRLTGYRRPSTQARWLSRRGYRFEVNALGKIIMLSSAVDQKLSPSAASPKKPNFEMLKDGKKALSGKQKKTR